MNRPRARRYSVCLLAAAALLPSAAPAEESPAAPDHGGIQLLHLQPRFENADGAATARRLLPREPLLAFNLVSGTLAHLAPGVSLSDLPGRFVGFERFDVDLVGWMTAARSRARPAGDKFPEGLSIAPSETRIGHVVAVAYAKGGTRVRLIGERQGMALRVPDGSATDTLNFFDRPCRIEGTARTSNGQEPISVDIAIPAPGFYLLALVRAGDAQLRLVANAVSKDVERELVISFP